jgi:hypothetical protein
MTAEIAILNKNGVALAADSKVTIGSPGQEKTFDTVNKLFSLSRVHPIGLMIFGNAEFMRYPWETIVKLYRQQKGAAGEPTVASWGRGFIRYLSSFGKIRDPDKSANVRTVLGSILGALQEEVFVEARRREIAIPSKDYFNLLSTRIQQAIITLQRLDDYFDEAQKTAFVTKYAGDISGTVAEYFGSFQDDELTKKTKELSLLAAFKKSFSPQRSGIVIAGFGTDEYFPALVSYDTDGYVGDVLKVSEDQSTEITREMPSTIRPFAQKEMVMRFMNGVDPALITALQKIFHATLTAACLDVLDKYGDPAQKTDATRQLIRGAAQAAFQSVVEQLGKISSTSFSQPIMQMVSLLPKDELPPLAESLVALTSLKRHVSRDAETVGGPIDVCLISKGDGFIWIKRKHYFKPELNPQFAHNYMRGISAAGETDEGKRARNPTGSARNRNKKKASPETPTAE